MKYRFLPFLFSACWLSPSWAGITDEFTKAAAASEHAVAGVAPWLFLQGELAHLAKGPLTAESSGPAITAISHYAAALAAEHVQLIVVPVPAKAEIYPDKFTARVKPDALAAQETAFIQGLKADQVDVIDLAEAFQAKRRADPATLLYCTSDAHWSPAGLAIAADLVFAAIKDKSWCATAQPLGDPQPLEITGDLMTTPATTALGLEKLTIQPTKTLVPAAAMSPAILLGDSHTLVFSAGAGAGFHCQGAGLLDLLQARTGTPFMIIANNGGGTDMARQQLARQAFPKPDFWKDKRVVVWCFSIREVTEKKWKDLPIKK